MAEYLRVFDHAGFFFARDGGTVATNALAWGRTAGLSENGDNCVRNERQVGYSCPATHMPGDSFDRFWRWAGSSWARPVLLVLGRPWWCACGRANPISLDVFSDHNSQHLFDP